MQVNISGMTVAVGMPLYGGMMPKQTAASLVKTATFCATSGVRMDLIIEAAPLPLSRDFVLDEFLAGDAQKLFWIDSDMVWQPAHFATMLALSQQVDVVCATYPSKIEKVQYCFTLPADPKRGPNGLIECNGAGLGYTVVDRKLCQQVSDSKPYVRDPMQDKYVRSVFRFDEHNGEYRTEDFAFFADIKAMGHTVWLCPYVELGHVGQRVWQGNKEHIIGR
jgi:hypothetical protein